LDADVEFGEKGLALRAECERETGSLAEILLGKAPSMPLMRVFRGDTGTNRGGKSMYHKWRTINILTTQSTCTLSAMKLGWAQAFQNRPDPFFGFRKLLRAEARPWAPKLKQQPAILTNWQNAPRNSRSSAKERSRMNIVHK
jgi:hypothetical protein